MKNQITLENCVMECYNNKDFVKEFNRLNGSLLRSKSSINKQINDVTEDDMLMFIKVVEKTIFEPLKRSEVYKC